MNTMLRRHSFSMLLLLLLFVGNSLWLYLVRDIPITDDDIWGATAVLGNPIEVVIFTLRWDLHPPLYYLLLDGWAYFGKSDLWLSMSSCLLHALIATLVFNYVYRRHGVLAALLSTVLVFSSPLLLEQSVKIRMYPLLALLSVAIFYLIEKYQEQNKRSQLLCIGILGFALIYSHAIGLILLFFHFCFGCWHLKSSQRRAWLVLHALLAVVALPVIANSLIRKLGHALTPAANQLWQLFQDLMVSTTGSLIAASNVAPATSGFGDTLTIAIILLLALQALLLVLAARDSHSRAMLICYLLLPILVFTTLSYSIKPLWLERNFIFALPIISIILGISLAKMPSPVWLKWLLVSAIAGINLSHSAIQMKRHPTEHSFAEVLEVLQAKRQANQKICVIAPNHVSTFWSLQRYLAKTEWGNPTEIQPALGERWRQIRAQLPHSVVDGLKMHAKTHFLESSDLIIAAVEVQRCQQADISGRFLVIETRAEQVAPTTYPLIFANDHYQIYGQEKISESVND